MGVCFSSLSPVRHGSIVCGERGLRPRLPGFRSQPLSTASWTILVKSLSWPSPYCWSVWVTVPTLLGYWVIEWDNSSWYLYMQKVLYKYLLLWTVEATRHTCRAAPCRASGAPLCTCGTAPLREGAELAKYGYVCTQGCLTLRKGGVSRALRCKHAEQPYSDPFLAVDS